MKIVNITKVIQILAPPDTHEVLPHGSSGKTQDGDLYFSSLTHKWYAIEKHEDITNLFAVARKKIWNPEGLSERKLKILTKRNRLLSREEHERIINLGGLNTLGRHKLYVINDGDDSILSFGRTNNWTYATPHPINYFLELPEEEFVNGKKESHKVAPKGFRLVTNEDYVIRKGDKVWWNTSDRWNDTRGLEGIKREKAYHYAKAFATPITEPKFKVGDKVKVIHPDGLIATIKEVRKGEDGSVKYDASFGCLILKGIEENQVYKFKLVRWCLDTAPKIPYYVRSNDKEVLEKKVFLVTGGRFEDYITIDWMGYKIDYQYLFENCEYSLDGKTNWKPCATQVELT